MKEGALTSAGYNQGIGKNPNPINIWNRNIIAVAPNAADSVLTDNKIAVKAKQNDCPAEDNIKSGRRPKRSINCQKGMDKYYANFNMSLLL